LNLLILKLRVVTETGTVDVARAVTTTVGVGDAVVFSIRKIIPDNRLAAGAADFGNHGFVIPELYSTPNENPHHY
jgi:hypothetical protein